MKLRPSSLHQPSARGFTVAEVLVVLGIMMVLLVGASTGFRKAWQGQEIRASAMHLAQDIALASQTAVRLNTPVELRLYKFQPVRVATDREQFFAWQLLLHGEPTKENPRGRATPLYEVQFCEGTTVIWSAPYYSPMMNLSTIIGDTIKWDKQFDPDVGIGDYEYVSIEFRPSGRTDLPADQKEPLTLTLVPVLSANALDMPKEYKTLSIEATTGTARLW